MKELATPQPHSIIEAHYPLPKKHRFMKRWVIAEKRENHEQQTGTNRCTEAAYHRIIEAIKSRYFIPGTEYFERDYKRDKTENCLAMHSFIMPSFYIYLESSFTYDYRVEYAFNNCSFEAELRAMLKPFPLDRQATEVKLQPDFKTFYDNIMRIQDQRFITSFKG